MSNGVGQHELARQVFTFIKGILFDAGERVVVALVSDGFVQRERPVDVAVESRGVVVCGILVFNGGSAVIEKYIAYSWLTVKDWQKFYTDFEVTEDNYHGVSMFVPQDCTAKHGELYEKFNKDITQMQWLSAVNK